MLATATTVSTVLRRTADLVRANWLQGVMWEPWNNGACLVGALALAGQETAGRMPPPGRYHGTDSLVWTPEAEAAIQAVMRALCPGWQPEAHTIGCAQTYLVAWNDEAERTQAQVLALLDAALFEIASPVAASKIVIEPIHDIAARVLARIDHGTMFWLLRLAAQDHLARRGECSVLIDA